MDLFTPVVPEGELHPNFRALIGNFSPGERAVLAEWADGFVDRDGKFVTEFQTTFNSGFWELYMFACCKELQFHVNFDFVSPDFVIDNFHNEFCIEAVIASNARGDQPEWKRDVKRRPKQPDLEAVLRTATIRLSNAIHSKRKKYLESYAALAHVTGRPFVLAVAPFEQPNFWAHNDHAIRQVLYEYDRVGADGEHVFRSSVEKAPGVAIELGLFAGTKMPEVSAIVYSNTATMSKLHALSREPDEMMFFASLHFNAKGSEPILWKSTKANYRESLLDGLYVFHNPYATYPLPFRYFNHNDITQATLLPGQRVPRYKCRHGHLIQRSSFRVRPRP